MDTAVSVVGKTALSEAAEICGGQRALADKLSAALDRPVTQQWVWAAINRQKVVPAEWCLPVEAATEGKITRHQLRPDLYPTEAAAA